MSNQSPSSYENAASPIASAKRVSATVAATPRSCFSPIKRKRSHNSSQIFSPTISNNDKIKTKRKINEEVDRLVYYTGSNLDDIPEDTSFIREDEEDDIDTEVDEVQEKKENENDESEEEDEDEQYQDDYYNEDEDDDEVFNPYYYISTLPPLSSLPARKELLPSRFTSLSSQLSNFSSIYSLNNKHINKSEDEIPTLVLDLDETLVHCSFKELPNYDFILPVSFENKVLQIYVKKRPYLDYFLKVLSNSFEVVLFTASREEYAKELVKKLDPDSNLIHYHLFRDSCVHYNGNYVKDLSILNRSMDRTLLVDNSPHAYGFQVDNGVPIISWYDDESDDELLHLLSFLQYIYKEPHYPKIVREYFKSYKRIARAKKGLPVSLCPPPL